MSLLIRMDLLGWEFFFNEITVIVLSEWEIVINPETSIIGKTIAPPSGDTNMNSKPGEEATQLQPHEVLKEMKKLKSRKRRAAAFKAASEDMDTEVQKKNNNNKQNKKQKGGDGALRCSVFAGALLLIVFLLTITLQINF